MTLLNTLKDDALAARKASAAVRSALLTTLFAEAAMVGKNAGNRETTDEEAVATVRKFLKNNLEAQAVIQDETRLAVLREEAAVLECYLPKMASEADVAAAVSEIVASLPERGPKAMGHVMAALKARFGTNYDASKASTLVRAALA